MDYFQTLPCYTLPNEVVANVAGLQIKSIRQKFSARPKKWNPKPYVPVPTPKTTKEKQLQTSTPSPGPWSRFFLVSRGRNIIFRLGIILRFLRRSMITIAQIHLPWCEKRGRAWCSARTDFYQPGKVLSGGRDGGSVPTPNCVVTVVIYTIKDETLPPILHTAVFKHSIAYTNTIFPHQFVRPLWQIRSKI